MLLVRKSNFLVFGCMKDCVMENCINMLVFMLFVFIFIYEIVNKIVRVWYEFFISIRKFR